MPLDPELFGSLEAPQGTEDLVRRAVRRAERIAAYEGRPFGIDRDAQNQNRADLARQIGAALRVRDLPRARELVEDGGALFGHSALAAEVERQSRDGHLATLKAAEEADQWSDDLEPSYYPDNEEWP